MTKTNKDINYAGALILKRFLKALVALNLSFLTNIDLAVAKWLRLYLELPVGTAMIFISEKLKDDCITDNITNGSHSIGGRSSLLGFGLQALVSYANSLAYCFQISDLAIIYWS